MRTLPLGRVMLGVVGLELTPEDRERLCHPETGGVILFARNYQEPAQVQALVQSIRALRQPELLLAVDHEGGPVQRFRQGFTLLPAMRRLGERYAQEPGLALQWARDVGRVLAAELRAVGLDFSFAPVLDREIGISQVIGERAFHAQPDRIVRLAGEVLTGMAEAGMVGVGKHFPGHGAVTADSHAELPSDLRPLAEIEATDLAAFLPLLPRLGGIMPAHVRYDAVDALPAGFSPYWLQTLLRTQWRFTGAIFSDDLGMGGAEGLGPPGQRAWAALDAGCDMVLICNDFLAMEHILVDLESRPEDSVQQRRLLGMRRWQAQELPPQHLVDARARLLVMDAAG